MVLWVYRDFVLQGVVPQFTTFEWIRRYTEPGEFTLVVPFSRDAFQLLREENILLHRETGEAAEIEEVNVVTSTDSSRKMWIKGRFVSNLLDRRVVTYQGSGSLQQHITNMLQQNFTAPGNANRRISNLRLLPFSIRNIPIGLDIQQENFLDVLSGLLLAYQIGLRVDYNVINRSFDVRLYEGRDSGAVFSSEYKNLLEQDYYRSRRNYRNTVLMEDYTYGDSNRGLQRREIRTTRSKDEQQSADEQARLFLNDFQATESYDAVLNPQSKQFEYRIDWDLGDIVSCRNEDYGVDITKCVMEVSEYYDRNGLHISVVFGDYLPSRASQLRSVIKWQTG